MIPAPFSNYSQDFLSLSAGFAISALHLTVYLMPFRPNSLACPIQSTPLSTHRTNGLVWMRSALIVAETRLIFHRWMMPLQSVNRWIVEAMGRLQNKPQFIISVISSWNSEYFENTAFYPNHRDSDCDARWPVCKSPWTIDCVFLDWIHILRWSWTFGVFLAAAYLGVRRKWMFFHYR